MGEQTLLYAQWNCTWRKEPLLGEEKEAGCRLRQICPFMVQFIVLGSELLIHREEGQTQLQACTSVEHYSKNRNSLRMFALSEKRGSLNILNENKNRD